MQTISSKDNELIKHIKKLKDKKERDLSNEYIIEGIKLIQEAIQENAKIKQKRFEGKIFNDYDIVVQNLEEFQDYASKKFYIKDIYEALIYKHQHLF